MNIRIERPSTYETYIPRTSPIDPTRLAAEST